MSHTPGPWTTKVSPHDNRVVLIDSKTHGAIGELVYADTRKAADAHLIAAAPDLLKALQIITADVCDRFDMDSDTTNPGMKWAVSEARAAIAKATGGAA